MCPEAYLTEAPEQQLKIRRKNMRKTFKVEGIDCPNCAAKLERNIKKIKGVEDAAVVYATGKLTVEAPDDKFEAIMDEAVALAAKQEPEWHIVR